MSENLKVKSINKIAKFSNMLNKLALYISGVLLIIFTLVVLLGVFFRYVLRSPLGWTAELSRYLLIWMTLLIASVGYKNNSHVALTFINKKFPDKLQKVIKYANRIALLTLLFFLIVEGYENAIDGFRQRSASLPITMALPFASIPVGAALVAIQMLLLTILELGGYEKTDRTS